MRLVPETEMSLGEVAKVVLGMDGGRTPAKDVDKKQLAIGMAVELEHTSDPKEAERITRQHLAEDGEYYTKPMKKDWGADEAKDRVEDLAKAASTRTASNRHVEEAFWCLMAGMPMDEVNRKYQLEPSDVQEMDNMAFAAGKAKSAMDLAKRVTKDQLPMAYRGLWDKYHGQKAAVQPSKNAHGGGTAGTRMAKKEFSNCIGCGKETAPEFTLCSECDDRVENEGKTPIDNGQFVAKVEVPGKPEYPGAKAWPSEGYVIQDANGKTVSAPYASAELAIRIRNRVINLHVPGKTAGTELTWREIRDREDPDGKGHDLRLSCTRCGNSQTCRCTKPKRAFAGICDSCDQKIKEAIVKQCEDEIKMALGQMEPVTKLAFVDRRVLVRIIMQYDQQQIMEAFKKMGMAPLRLVGDNLRHGLEACEEKELMGILDALRSIEPPEDDPQPQQQTLVAAAGRKPSNGVSVKTKDGHNFSITCDRCGGPMVGSDDLGMHCAKRCYDEDNKAAKGKLDGLMRDLMRDMPPRIASRVFVFEDDPERIALFRKAFGAGNIVTTSSVSEGLSMLREGGFSRIYLDRDVSNPKENGEDLAWEMEKEALCKDTPVVIHSENTRGQKVMARYIGRYHPSVSVVPFRSLRKSLEIPGGMRP